MCRMSALGITCLLATPGCEGSWAQATVVTLAPVANSQVKGLAVVSQGCRYDSQGNRCIASGSIIKSQLLSAKSKTGHYRVILVRANCVQPFKGGLILEDGESVESAGSAQVDVPIIELTGGEYVVVVQTVQHKTVACGVIRRDGLI